MNVVELLFKKNYLTMIENSVKGENHLFRNFFIKTDGKEIDVLNNGRWSCAVLVSSILYLNKLIGDTHTNVSTTVEDMIKVGWLEIAKPKIGAVLLWEKKIAQDDGKEHAHIGFYIGDDMAISNDSKITGFPIRHHYTYNDNRKIEKIFWHPSLN